MKGKITLFFILALIVLFVSGCVQPPTKEQVEKKFYEFRVEYEKKKSQGYDVTEAEILARKAKQAFDRGDYEAADRFLNEAFEALKKAEPKETLTPTPEATTPSTPPTTPATPEEAKEKLSAVKVAVVYESITDYRSIEAMTDGAYKRTIDDVINILKETRADFVFRAFWRWQPVPESPAEATQNQILRGYTYEDLRQAIASIKEEMPDVIICGAIPAQKIECVERDPITGETLDEDETWAMALDPEKWGLGISKDEFQKEFGESQGWNYKYTHYPDITNPNFQKLILSWAKKQIDCGVDAIWIDLLFTQAERLRGLTKDPNHPAVKESYDAACKIIDEIHEYGLSKGKYVYVGTWAFPTVDFPYPPPNLDFVTMTPSSGEILNKKLDENEWSKNIEKVREKLGDIPIIAFIDWADDRAPMARFSQELSKEEQKEMIEYLDQFFQSKGIIFAYPVHGGWMGDNAKILSYGKSRVYDSLAPEFETYETIKELARSNSPD
ncbi:hypothetical protein DRP04_12455 [Archaeoglobales archaeon]|nr:MAG: hypothetical protein DRP04_12455 [Archaeoglobales archaeon]